MASFTFAANPDPCAGLPTLETTEVGTDVFYKIGTADDLYSFACMVNNGGASINGMLTADIVVNENLLGTDNANVDEDGSFNVQAYKTANGAEPRAWTPIGTDEYFPYTGTFTGKDTEGNVHTISGLYCNFNYGNIGLFGYVEDDAVIKDIGVLDSYFFGDDRVGGVAGSFAGAIIDSVYSAAVVKGVMQVGGVVGENYGLVENVYNTGSVIDLYRIGGVVGDNVGGIVKNAYNKGSVTGNGKVGGVVGYAEYGGEIRFCYNEGSISLGNMGCSEYDCDGYGGVVGANGYDNDGDDDNLGSTISDVFNVGDVWGYNAVGGAVGLNLGAVNFAYNAAKVKDECSDPARCNADYEGGIVGIVYDGTVENAYNNGDAFAGASIGTIFDISASAINVENKSDDAFTDGTVLALLNNGRTNVWMEDPTTHYPVPNMSYSAEPELVNGVYQIATFDNLLWFADAVNKGNTTISAKLTADIVLNANLLGENNANVNEDGSFNISKYGSEPKSWTPIGTDEKPFIGTFDGTVARLLHDWCEMDGGVCKYGGLNGSIWGQDVSLENSMPTFTDIQSEKVDAFAYFYGLGGLDSVQVDGSFKGNVEFFGTKTINAPVSIVRNFAGIAGEKTYSTMMLPFSSNKIPNGVSFYGFTSVVNNNGKWSVNMEKVDAVMANTPYLVLVPSGKNAIKFEKVGEFAARNLYLYETSVGNWKFTGTYRYWLWQAGDADIGKTYGFAANDGVNDPSIVGKFAKVGAGAYIYPMRAYLEYTAPVVLARPAANGAVRAGAANIVASLPETIDVVIVDKGNVDTEVAGSDDASGEQTTKVVGSLNTRTGEIKFATDRWFDLQGRYLGVKKPTQKGTYYNNGKKVVVK